MLLGALIGSRAVFVMVDWAYYQLHPVEIIQVWLGGLSGVGALVGAVLAAVITSLWWKLPANMYLDATLPLLGTITITSWLGCWLDRCAYGQPTNAWWGIPARDEWGVLAPRVPVQILGAILTLVLIWWLDRSTKVLPIHGLRAGLGLFGVSAVLFGLSYLRADPAEVWRGLRLDAWGALGLMIFSTVAVVVLLSVGKMRKKGSPRPSKKTGGGENES